jgi:hypothetical protein
VPQKLLFPERPLSTFSSAGLIKSDSSSLSAAAESSFSSIMVGVSKSSPSDFGAGIGAGVYLMSRASQGVPK